MKAPGSRMENGEWPARSVLDGGGPPPLSNPRAGRTRSQSARGLAQSKTWRSFVASLVLVASATVAHTQSYSIDWSTIDGGGGTSTGGVYSVSGIIGQPDAGGPMTGGQYSLTGGFWSLYAVQTPGAPLLTITLTPTNTAMVYWPSPSTGWTLQENTNTVSSANWSDHPYPQDNGTLKYIIVSPPIGNRFYRLKK